MESAVDRLKSLFESLAPPRLVSWQSMFLFGLAMWVLSGVVMLADPERTLDLFLLQRFGWVFIAGGIVWRQALDPVRIWGFPVGAVAASLVLVNLIFEDEVGQWRQSGFIALPIFSGLLVAMSYFLSTSGRWRVPNRFERLKSIVALGIGLVLACWLNFYFITQDWLVQYPGLWNARIDNSNFMALVKDPRQDWGRDLVAEVDFLLYDKFHGRPWPQIERALEEYGSQPESLERDLRDSAGRSFFFKLPFRREPDWNVTLTTSGDGNPSYLINTRVTWESPLFFDDRDFTIVRSCEIARAPLPLELFNESTQTGLISCNTSPEFIFREEPELEEASTDADAETPDAPTGDTQDNTQNDTRNNTQEENGS
ncbi:MAG: DUF5357 family protein [Geitlerinemataceae cyanobacterium]